MRKNEVGMGHCSLFVALKRLSTFFWAEVSLALSVPAVVKDSKPVSIPVVQGRSLAWLLHGLYSTGVMSLATFPWTW
ncbi:hypothetical protein I312_104598 [Cryptococcus bacillisporus CA1280]|uniref:uncharacterized protein n=1 Tax=Cryptococcus bacillisporus CA1280 TaxID=1296109 RepID=UPI003367E369